VTIHASLQHKHICDFHHYFEDSKHCYILLELCPKGTLYHVIQARGKLDELEAACFLFDLTKAVSHLHSNRILHADVKPQNCFLTSNMNLKLGDFGLSVRLGPNQNTCTKKCGTPNYVAPEILEKREKRGYSLEVDVWSMGCVLYCMLVGVPPFQSQSVKETCVKIHSGKYSIPSFVSDDARDLITKMLHMNPKKRYASSLCVVVSYRCGSVARVLRLHSVIHSRRRRCLLPLSLSLISLYIFNMQSYIGRYSTTFISPHGFFQHCYTRHRPCYSCTM
jgi:serine/threonine protein kinase